MYFFSRRLKSESGTAILEFSAVIPAFLMLLMGAFDFGVAAERYLALSRIVYEGARYGASIPGLEEGSFVESESEDIPTNQAQLWYRVDQLLAMQSFEGVTMETTFTKEGTTPMLTVVLQYEHEPSFPLFAALGDGYDTIPMQLTVRSPYLNK